MRSPLNDNVFALHVPKLTQTLAECLETGRRRSAAQVSYPRDFRWLLRLGGQAKRKEHGAKRKANNFFTHEFFLLAFADN
jgi:hypothetical protein